VNAETPTLYVVDNTVLSNFAHIERPDLLQIALAGRGVITGTVRQELEVGEMSGSLPRCDWRWLPIIELSKAERELADLFR
jgi:predicted nucleic acid-binding protein